MSIPSYKEIIELLKVGATIEAQEKIMGLRQSALEVQEENIELRTRILDLETQVRELENLEGEPCPRCRKRTWVVEKSEPDPMFGRLGGVSRTYRCTDCDLTERIMVTPSKTK